MIAQCRSCNAPIFWAESVKGKIMPMNSDPAADGTFRLVDRAGENPLAVFVRQSDRDAGLRLYACHYATCPDAKVWRK